MSKQVGTSTHRANWAHCFLTNFGVWGWHFSWLSALLFLCLSSPGVIWGLFGFFFPWESSFGICSDSFTESDCCCWNCSGLLHLLFETRLFLFKPCYPVVWFLHNWAVPTETVLVFGLILSGSGLFYVETVLFGFFSLCSREEPLRNGVLVIKMLWELHPSPNWDSGQFYV